MCQGEEVREGEVGFKLIEKDVLYGLEQGNKVLKEINSEMSMEKVEKILDDTEEAVSYQNELSERLGSLLTNGEEEEVDEELRQLELEMGVTDKQESVRVSVPKQAETDSAVRQKLDSLPAAPSELHVPQKEAGAEEGLQPEEPDDGSSRVAQLA
ncbi:hypothetical protein PMKS-000109 [Pichia membranifaciens]|uniref:Charged multivesicular body protein 6 n=1 Tax=Pichia membranifaciens TaxID=4926 RepID=A0A1Q2YAT3_9ASCO|nr:hypothetical protein PMKS-000109 [Pichia membranifaciens]